MRCRLLLGQYTGPILHNVEGLQLVRSMGHASHIRVSFNYVIQISSCCFALDRMEYKVLCNLVTDLAVLSMFDFTSL